MTKTRTNWKRVRPTSLPHAMELCLDHAREKHNRSLERVAEIMGLSNKFTLYKWVESGKLPANAIKPFQFACGIDFVCQWLAHTDNKLLIEMPIGRDVTHSSMAELHQEFSDAYNLLAKFYEGKADQEDTIFSLTRAMESFGWHRANVDKHEHPELDFS